MALAPHDLATSPASGEVEIAGRAIEARGRSIVLADAFATVRVELAEGEVEPFDLIVVRGEIEGGVVKRAHVVERHRPSSQRAGARESETGRLLQQDVGRNMRARRTAMAAVRSFFGERGFLEVDTPSIVPSPGLDLHLDAFDAGGGVGYLITSPEYQMKRLLAGGVPRCFQLARCFRRGEDGARHNREFVMLEWYRAFSTVDAVIDDTEALVKHVANALGAKALRVADRAVALDARFDRLTVLEAFERFAGVAADDVIAMAGDDEDRFFSILVERVEPALAKLERPVFLTEYPAPVASLARKKPGDPRVAERFELYAGGVELCNGFGELTDPVEQRARLEHDRSERERRGLPVYPIDERFLAALEEGMPPSGGNALGFDRLVMLCLGATSIGDVTAFPAAWL